MPLAIFVVLALAIMALAINRLTTSSFSAAIQEGISVQSFFAAESGAQWALHSVLYGANSARESTQRCKNLQGRQLDFNARGLGNCHAKVLCRTLHAAGDPATPNYEVLSSGTCGEGDLAATRTVGYRARYEPISMQSGDQTQLEQYIKSDTEQGLFRGHPKILYWWEEVAPVLH